MRRIHVLTLLFVVLAGCPAPRPVEAPPQRPAAPVNREFRGIWITRFDWTDRDPEKCRADIVRIIETVADSHFNAVVFQIRGAAETLYPSSLEPWSPLLGEGGPGFDPVKLAIEQAHKHGLEFHAYINPMPLWSSRWKQAPADEKHLYHAHGPGSANPWLCVDSEGKPSSEEYLYLSPGVPGVHAYLREVILDVVRRYDVDGIHLDRIRYPGPQYSHDAVSEQRFAGRGNPNRKEWVDWQREQLDKFVNDLSAEIWAEKPRVVVSCAAWGIYDRYHIDGYYNFSSGYHDYFQDTWNWCRLGAMDVLMPMIYWDIPEPKPNYNELLDDFARGVGKDHLVGGQLLHSLDENVKEIEVTREAGALGTVLFSYGRAERNGLLARCRRSVYLEKAEVPKPDRVVNPRFGAVLGSVLRDDGEPLVDAWVSIGPVAERRSRRGAFSRTWTSGADGRFAFLNVPPGPVNVTVRYPGAMTKQVGPVVVSAGQTSKIDVTVEGAEAAQQEPFFLHVIAPAERSETTAEVVHVLGKVAPECKVRVGDEDVEVYSTGGFARDDIPLELGSNGVEVVATAPDGKTVTRALTVIRKKRPPPSPPEELKVVEPAQDLAVLPGEVLSIRAGGPPGLSGYATGFGQPAKWPLTEVLSDDGQPTGRYTAAVRVGAHAFGLPLPVRVCLQKDGAEPLWAESEGKVEVWDPLAVRVGETQGERTGITFGTHQVRLGGPFLAEVPAGTRFEIVGAEGPNFRIRLSEALSGWVAKRDVVQLPAGTPPPHNFFTSCHIGGDDKYDKLSIRLREKVVFAVTSETEPANQLHLDLFNTHHATTWLTHRSDAKVIGPVHCEQMADGWVRLTVPLRCKWIWGYWTERDGNVLNLYVRRPPDIAAAPDSPLKGRLVALEPGHGGRNSGAVGLMGTKEKTVNVQAVNALKKALEEHGAEVVIVRPGDSSPSLWERARRANEAQADLYVSVHANATGRANGYLRVSGTSTYYKDEHCRRPAELVYNKLLELGWNEFGVVGNFSYAPLRNTYTPGILIEQAFMSHLADEARLLDPEYQRAQAEAVASAVAEFFDSVRE